jgi:hypothetical protein
MKLLFPALLASSVLILLTTFFENNALALFPTHDSGGVHGFTRSVGYGLPFAFREVVSLIDTSAAHYHWGIFALDVCLIAVVLLLCLHLAERWRGTGEFCR